jgi:CheY-specific phosphatase CheX
MVIGENGFISTPEAIRQLTIAKKEQIELQNQIARSERIPIGDVNEAVGQVFGAIRGIVKANLSVEHANEVFDEMRRVCDWIQKKPTRLLRLLT